MLCHTDITLSPSNSALVCSIKTIKCANNTYIHIVIVRFTLYSCAELNFSELSRNPITCWPVGGYIKRLLWNI